jgi:protein transport protein SEC31
MVPRNFNWDQGKERLVKQNILIGNYDGAIDAALKCGRTAEALIIAFSVGQNLFNNTLKTFFTETTDNFITDVLKHIAYKDPEELVKRYDLKKWKECIALIYTLSSKDKRAALLGQLAHRLRTESPETEAQLQQIPIPEDHPAVICHVLAEDFAKITQIYCDNLRSLESSLQRK